MGAFRTPLITFIGTKKIQVVLQLDSSRILRINILDLTNNHWHQKLFYEHSLKCLAQGHSTLKMLQNRESVLGCLSPKTASSSSDPHCLLSCCFSCDTLSFPLYTNTYNFPALIRQNKNQQQQKRDKKATIERSLSLQILLLLPLRMKTIITV